jgi:hypothetical protein
VIAMLTLRRLLRATHNQVKYAVHDVLTFGLGCATGLLLLRLIMIGSDFAATDNFADQLKQHWQSLFRERPVISMLLVSSLQVLRIAQRAILVALTNDFV